MTTYRWLRVSSETGVPVGPRCSYPSEALCRAFCGEGEVPAPAVVKGRPGPFQDQLELVSWPFGVRWAKECQRGES